ncbi:MAG: hypothetical protein ACI9R3_003052, partial [Verrucomicrobiales bacterium]
QEPVSVGSWRGDDEVIADHFWGSGRQCGF